MEDSVIDMNVLVVLSKTPERIAVVASSEIVATGYGTFQLMGPQQCRIGHLKERRKENLIHIIFSTCIEMN